MKIDRIAVLEAAKTFSREPVEGFAGMFAREVSAEEAKVYSDKQKSGADEMEAAAWLAVRVLCDEDGNQLLTDEDIPALRKGRIGLLTKIGKAAAKVAGWTDPEAAKKNESNA